MSSFLSILLIVLSVSMSIFSKQVSYHNYKVFRIVPETTEQIEVLHRLQYQKGYSFWLSPSQVSRRVSLQVAPTQLNEFYELMKSASINYKILIADLQEKLNEQNTTFHSRAYGNSDVDWYHYNTLEEIYYWMDQLPQIYGNRVEKIIGGSTFQGRWIQGVRIRSFSSRPAVFIEGGQHPREWISPATVTYLIRKLLDSDNPRIQQLAESYDWHIFPVCNPDGYVYTFSDDRLWRKTLNDFEMGPYAACKGVDLNRNFPYKWQEGDAERITDPCHELYPGPYPFSEVEARTLAEYIESINENLIAYLSFHSPGQVMLIPYGYTKRKMKGYQTAYHIATATANALAQRYHTRYRAGVGSEMYYLYSGSSMDWAKGQLKVPVVYAYELRDEGEDGFLLPPEQILPNCKEVFDSLLAMFQEIEELEIAKKKFNDDSSGPDQFSSSGPGQYSGSGSSQFSGSGSSQFSGSGSSSRSRSKKSIFKLPKCFGGSFA